MAWRVSVEFPYRRPHLHTEGFYQTKKLNQKAHFIGKHLCIRTHCKIYACPLLFIAFVRSASFDPEILFGTVPSYLCPAPHKIIMTSVTAGAAGPRKLLPDSELWDIQRAWYESSALEAYKSSALPHWISSNSYIAARYANMCIAYAQDCWGSRSGGAAVSADGEAGMEPIHIVELGAGHGKLGFLVLTHLVRMRAQRRAQRERCQKRHHLYLGLEARRDQLAVVPSAEAAAARARPGAVHRPWQRDIFVVH